MMVVLFPALTSLAAAQNPAASAKPAGKPVSAMVKARWHVLGAHPLEMYYYSEGPQGIESLEQHAAQMTIIAPQSYSVDEEGFVRGEVPPEILEIAMRAKVAVMPLVVNPGFDRDTASALLHSRRAQQRAVAYLASIAKRNNFVGWQLDLEYIDPEDKSYYTQFARRVAARLHREGRLLSIAVVPRFSDVYPDLDPSREFHSGEWGAPYDFRALGRVVDFMTLMTYDHHSRATPPGPVAGYDWVKAALDYATERVPRQKILLGIPFYGREWTQSGDETSARTLTFEDAQDQMEQLRVESLWDERWRTPWFQYSDDSGMHTGWYEDSKSLEVKLELMREYRLRGFAAWRLGVEDPAFWSLADVKGRTELERRKRSPRHQAGSGATLANGKRRSAP
jgi:spore germination protein YaaH